MSSQLRLPESTRFGRAALAVSAVSLLLLAQAGFGSAGAATPAGTSAATSAPATSGPAAPTTAPSVQITAVSPPAPLETGPNRQITVSVVVSAGSSPLADVALDLQRGNPLINERQLADALTTAPPTTDVNIPPVPVVAAIPAGASRAVVLVATVDRTDDANVEGLCLSCNPGVYPVDVVLTQTATGAELARAHTFIPSFQSAPTPVQVSWIWPLLDRPHRGASPTVFTDDELAASVSPNGRLDRALRVAELVAGKVRLTLVVDPEVIDSLVVMSGPYRVVGADGVARAGTRSAAARDWLRRLARVLKSHDVTRTAYADPDVDSLARNGISWTPVLDAQVERTLVATLGVDPDTAISWPAGQTLSSQGLDSVVSNGASAVLLTDTVLPGGISADVTPNAIAPLPSASGTAQALVLDSNLQPLVATVTSRSANPQAVGDASRLLLAELAIRGVAQPTQSHYAVLAPTRYVDADPARTAAVMTTIAGSVFSRDVSIRTALDTVASVDHGPLVATAATGLSPGTISTLVDTRSHLDALRECLLNNNASTLLGNYPAALARSESIYWTSHVAAGLAFAAHLRASVATLTSRVRITSPNNASYTLASSDAPLFITVENSLSVSVSIGLRVDAPPGQQGLLTRPVAVAVVPPGIHQFKVGTHVERTGRFKLMLTLVSPTGRPLGESSEIRVKSTAFGAVALWITGVAFGVLLLALILRTVRRVQHRRPRPRREMLATPTGAI